MENINEPFEALVKATFKNKQAYDDFASGIVHSDKGLRVDNGNMVSQPDIASASKEDLLKELRKYPTEPRKEYYREPQYTRHYYEESERSYTLKDAVVDGFKEGIATAIINFVEDMLYNPVKREIFLTRSKNFWNNNLSPAFKKSAEKIKFAIDIIHAVRTNEQPKYLQIIEQSKTAVATTEKENKKQSSNTLEYIFTEEQSKKIMLIMYLLTDIMKNGTIEKGSMTNEEYQIVQKKQQELLASKITNEAIKLTQNNDFIFDDSLEIIRRYCSGDLELATMNNSPLIEKR